jgi:hypothetical protein
VLYGALHDEGCAAAETTVMSALRVELFYDEEAGNWHYRVPAPHINGSGTATRADAERECRAAIAFAIDDDTAPPISPGRALA